ncbi:unnamed protein product, partial [Polarella glacialis]
EDMEAIRNHIHHIKAALRAIGVDHAAVEGSRPQRHPSYTSPLVANPVIANSASAITFRAPSMESASDLNSFRGGDMQRSSSAFSAVRAHSPRSSGFRSPVLTPAGSVRSMSSRGYATPSRGGVAGPPSSGGYMSARPSSQPSAAPQATAVVVPQWAWQAPSAASGGARAPVVATVVPHKNLLTNSSQDVLAQLVTPSRAVRRAPVQ